MQPTKRSGGHSPVRGHLITPSPAALNLCCLNLCFYKAGSSAHKTAQKRLAAKRSGAAGVHNRPDVKNPGPHNKSSGPRVQMF